MSFGGIESNKKFARQIFSKFFKISTPATLFSSRSRRVAHIAGVERTVRHVTGQDDDDDQLSGAAQKSISS